MFGVKELNWALKEKQRQTLERERGASVFAPGSRSGFALVYPNTYYVGMSNLGFHIIYEQINSRGDTACERAFLPDAKILQEYVRTNTPILTIETQRPIYEFPLIGFAVSFEMDYFNVLTLLAQGKIPLRSADRQERDPIVLIGGPCATFNPEPLAEFVDVVIIGEGEEVIQEILDAYYECGEQSLTREQTLLRLAQIEGVYVPCFYSPIYDESGCLLRYDRHPSVPETIKRRWIQNLDGYRGQTVIVSEDTEFSEMFLIEITRGCGRHCRFCMAGYCFRNPRARSLAKLEEAVRTAQQYRGKVGLVGAAVSDYLFINELSQQILHAGMHFSVASLRADTLTPELVRGLAESGHKTVTLAPEAASMRMRCVINKGITDEHLYRAVEMAIEAGIPNIRFYIMIGLPFEEAADVQAVVQMAKDVKRYMAGLGSRGKLTLSINPFIPKPFTPFQWQPMAPVKDVEAKLKLIQNELRAYADIEVLVESPKESYIQAVLARGDRKLSSVLYTAHELGGVKGWKQAVKQQRTDLDFYLYRQRTIDETLPWGHLDMGLKPGYLEAELAKAAEGQATAACTKGCTRCGVCPK